MHVGLQPLLWIADLYEFDPEQTRKAPFRVRVRTTLPFLGSRFESVRTITISDEVPGVSCRHTLTGYVRVCWQSGVRCCSVIPRNFGLYMNIHGIFARWDACSLGTVE